MQIARTPFLIALAGLSAFATAEFTGPAPVAWRWAQPTSAAPAGNIAHINDTIFTAVGSRIYAVNREAGTQVWRFPVAEPLPASFRTGVVLDGNTIVAAADNSVVYGLDATTGTQKWSYTAPSKVSGIPVLAEKYIILPLADRTLMAIWAEDGRAAWDKPIAMDGGVLGRITASNNIIYVVDGGLSLSAIDVGSKKIIWTQRFANLDPDVRPTVFNEAVYVNSGDFIIGLGARDGRRRQQINTQNPLVKSPAMSTDGIAVLTRNGTLLTYDLSGRPLTRKPVDLQGTPLSDPVIVGKQIAVTTSNGSLNMFSLATGARTWDFIIRPMTRTNNDPSSAGGGGGESAATKPVTFVQAAGNPVSIGGSLLLPARDGSLICFDRTNGLDLTSPDIRMVYPNPGDQFSNQPPVDVAFQLEDEGSGINRDSVLVTVDGQKVDFSLTRDGLVMVKFTNDGKNRVLPDGRKVFKVAAIDWMGNERVREFVLTLDATIARPGAKAPASGGGGRRGVGSGGG
jgi:hypothetical protein